MLPNEQKVLEEMKTVHNKYFVPLVWTTSLVTRARKEGRIKDDYAVKTLIDVCIPIHPDYFMFECLKTNISKLVVLANKTLYYKVK